jgi:CysZ protein
VTSEARTLPLRFSTMAKAVSRPLSAGRQFVTGIGMLGRGLAMYGRNPGVWLLGLLPALIAGLLIVAVFVTLIWFIDEIASGVTWFADGWPSWERDTIHILAGISVLGVCGLLAVVTFTSITLAIGEPFYEKISERVETQLGGAGDAIDLPFWAEFWRGITESIRMIAISASIGIPLFFAGFIPGVGQTVVPAIGALFGGWFLAVELTGVPFTRRGLKLKDRRRLLKTRRPMAVGFGAAVFVCFLIPLGAVLIMPAAVAGATLLARRVLDENPDAAPTPRPLGASPTVAER